MEPFHWTGWHTFIVVLAPFLVSLLREGVRNFLVERVWGGFWFMVTGKSFKEEQPEKQEFVTIPAFEEHKDGDSKTLSSILAGIDQNGRVVEAAAQRVEKNAHEMREEGRLIHISLDEHRREIDTKIGQLHDKINATNSKVDTLQGATEAVIRIAQGNLGKTGTGG